MVVKLVLKETPESLKDVERELDNHVGIPPHPNIIEFKGYCEEVHGIVTEFMECGTVVDYWQEMMNDHKPNK